MRSLFPIIRKFDFEKSILAKTAGKTLGKSIFQSTRKSKHLKRTKNIIADLKRVIFSAPLITVGPLRDGEKRYFFIETYPRDDLMAETVHLKTALPNLTWTTLLGKRRRRVGSMNLVIALLLTYIARNKLQEFFKASGLSKSLDQLECYVTIYVALVELLDIARKVEITDCAAVISFQEMVPTENLVCQYANVLGVPTVALVHALGVVGSTERQESVYSLMHYKASVCKNVFCWGEIQAESYRRFTQSAVRIIGKSDLITVQNEVPGVMLVFDLDEENNVNLLKMGRTLQKLGIAVSYWLKPSSAFSATFGVTRVGPPRDIVVGYKSSLLVQLGFKGLRIFVVDGSPLADHLAPSVVIKDIKDLQLKAIESPEAYPHDIWKKFIAFDQAASVSELLMGLENLGKNTGRS